VLGLSKREKKGSWLILAKSPSEKRERGGGLADSGDKRGGTTGGESAGRRLDGKLKISLGSLPLVVGDLNLHHQIQFKKMFTRFPKKLFLPGR
jgi:hypothetical protein